MTAESEWNIELANDILNVNAVISALASFLTLTLMAFMWRNGTLRVNLFIKCVIHMTFFQCWYDASLPFSNSWSEKFLVWGGIVIGGMGASLWSLMILLAAIFTVMRKKTPTKAQQMASFIGINALIAAYGVAFRVLADRNISIGYSAARFAIIGLDFLAFFKIFHLYRQKGVGKDRTQNPLFHVLRRLIFYPIIQVITRLGATAINTAHGDSHLLSPPKDGTFLDYFGSLLVPSAGLGAFVVFIFLQKNAKAQLGRLLRLDFALGDGGKSPSALDEKARKSIGGGQGQGLSEQEHDAAYAGAGGDEREAGTVQRPSTAEQEYDDNACRLSIMDEQVRVHVCVCVCVRARACVCACGVRGGHVSR